MTALAAEGLTVAAWARLSRPARSCHSPRDGLLRRGFTEPVIQTSRRGSAAPMSSLMIFDSWQWNSLAFAHLSPDFPSELQISLRSSPCSCYSSEIWAA
jgi:hypothetical protein